MRVNCLINLGFLISIRLLGVHMASVINYEWEYMERVARSMCYSDCMAQFQEQAMVGSFPLPIIEVLPILLRSYLMDELPPGWTVSTFSIHAPGDNLLCGGPALVGFAFHSDSYFTLEYEFPADDIKTMTLRLFSEKSGPGRKEMKFWLPDGSVILGSNDDKNDN